MHTTLAWNLYYVANFEISHWIYFTLLEYFTFHSMHLENKKLVRTYEQTSTLPVSQMFPTITVFGRHYLFIRANKMDCHYLKYPCTFFTWLLLTLWEKSVLHVLINHPNAFSFRTVSYYMYYNIWTAYFFHTYEQNESVFFFIWN